MSNTQRAGYTVVTFVVDIGSSMAKERVIEVPGIHGEPVTVETTSLARALQFVKLKVQEMIFNGRKTDKCSVITVGSEGTKNALNQQGHGYDNITEYIRIVQPSAVTLAKIDRLEPSTESADILDALIVATEAQQEFLGSKSWTRKIVLITDAESSIDRDGWEVTVDRLKDRNTHLTIVGVDFDEEEYFKEEDKSATKAENEEFFHEIEETLNAGEADLCLVGNLEYALESVARPESKLVKSTLASTVLRLGDVESHSEEAIEITIRTSKCTAVTHPKSWKKYTKRLAEDQKDEDDDVVMGTDPDRPEAYVLLKQRTEYTIDESEDEEDQEKQEEREDEDMDVDEEEEPSTSKKKRKQVEKEELVRGYKFGSDYIPAEYEFPRLPTKRGMEIGGFFKAEKFRREYSMGEVYYVWADPAQPLMQVALSSLAQAMDKEGVYAFARWASKDGADAKMGVLVPTFFEQVHCLLWARMPYADDVRKYAFEPLERLVNRKGVAVRQHPYLPTEEQMDAMEKYVDAMDLMQVGEKDEEGNRQPWFNTIESYNPALHRIKQAHFHCAVVSDVVTNPVPPIHPELTRFFEVPSKILKSSKKMQAIEACAKTFNVREVTKGGARRRKHDHQHAEDDDELLIGVPSSRSVPTTPSKATPKKNKQPIVRPAEDSETESESDIEMPVAAQQAVKPPEEEKKKEPSGPSRPNLPTPDRSPSPEVDAGRAHGRIIGSTYPLKDFMNNLKRGDLVSKAVEDMAVVIREIVMKPFATKRQEELIKCLKSMRDTCLKEDEIEQWNKFIKDLKEDCLGYPGNRPFWTRVQREGRSVGPIGDQEASQLGGTSDFTEQAAIEFMA